MIKFVFKPKGHRIWRGRYRLKGGIKIEDVTLQTHDRRIADQRLDELVQELEMEAAGIILPKPIRDAAARPIIEHLNDYVADLRALGRADKHINNIEFRVGRLIQECQWKRGVDVTADSFVTWRGKQNLAAKTINDYLGAIISLLNWMKHNKRILDNALDAVKKVDTTGEETRIRRAFTDDEIQRLLNTAGKYRAVYLMAVNTGLRRSELAELLWSDLELSAAIPVVHVRASISKNGKATSIPLHPDVVVALQALRNGSQNEDCVFQRVPRIERFRRDLKKAGIAYVDASGRYADFHSLRNTFGTNLMKSKATPRVAMELMRHSDMRLTTKIYTDAMQLPTAAAVQSLPSFGGN